MYIYTHIHTYIYNEVISNSFENELFQNPDLALKVIINISKQIIKKVEENVRASYSDRCEKLHSLFLLFHMLLSSSEGPRT